MTANFVPWTPHEGTIFVRPTAFDTETTRIDEQRPWLSPAYVLGAVYDGRQGRFVERQHLAAFLAAHRGLPLIMHSAAFDLAVIQSSCV